LLKKLRDTGVLWNGRLVAAGDIHSSRTTQNIEDLAVSEEHKPGIQRLTRQIARETGVSQFRCKNIDKDTSLKCFKRCRTQELAASNRLTRLVRSQQLLKRYLQHWFAREKIFTVAVLSIIRKTIVFMLPVICSRNRLLRNDFFEHEIRSQFSAFVMTTSHCYDYCDINGSKEHPVDHTSRTNRT